MVLMEEILTAVEPTLVRATESVEEDPSGVPPNRKVVGASSTSVPRPLTAVLCGLVLSLSVTVILPVLFPVPLGVKVTQMLHDGVQLPSALCGLRIVPAEIGRAS